MLAHPWTPPFWRNWNTFPGAVAPKAERKGITRDASAPLEPDVLAKLECLFGRCRAQSREKGIFQRCSRTPGPRRSGETGMRFWALPRPEQRERDFPGMLAHPWTPPFWRNWNAFLGAVAPRAVIYQALLGRSSRG